MCIIYDCVPLDLLEFSMITFLTTIFIIQYGYVTAPNAPSFIIQYVYYMHLLTLFIVQYGYVTITKTINPFLEFSMITL